MKYFNRTSIIVLITSIIVLIISITQIARDSSLKEIFWTTLVGISMEGILFVGIIESIETSKELNHMEKLKKSLLDELSFLQFVLENCIYNSELISKHISSSKHFANDIKTLRYKFKGNDSFRNADFIALAEDVALQTKNKAELHLDRLRCLSPVAAEIGGEFMLDWIFITDKLTDIAQREKFNYDSINFLGSKWTSIFNSISSLFVKFQDLKVPVYATKTPPIVRKSLKITSILKRIFFR